MYTPESSHHLQSCKTLKCPALSMDIAWPCIPPPPAPFYHNFLHFMGLFFLTFQRSWVVWTCSKRSEAYPWNAYLPSRPPRLPSTGRAGSTTPRSPRPAASATSTTSCWPSSSSSSTTRGSSTSTSTSITATGWRRRFTRQTGTAYQQHHFYS